MLQSKRQNDRMEKDIKRSLQNLKIFSKQIDNCLPAFYYCAQLLLRYAQQNGPENINHQHFQKFDKNIQVLTNLKDNKIKKHHRDIIAQILQIKNSTLFTQCIKKDIGNPINLFTTSSEQQGSVLLSSKITSSIKVKNSFSQKQSSRNSFQQEHQQTNLRNREKRKIDDLWQRLKIAYYQHRIDEANQLKNIFRKKKYPITTQQESLFQTIQLQYNTMNEFYKQFDQNGWQFDKCQDGVTLQFKVFQQEKQIAIRIQSQFDICIQNFLAILCEIDLFHLYTPFCYDTKEEKVISRNQKIGTSKIYIPLLTDRQTYFYAVGYDRYNVNGSVFVYSKTINEDKVYQEKYDYKVPQKTKYVRLQYKFFLVQFIPITKQRARIRLASKIDMKMNFIPSFIINASARRFAFNYFKNIIKVNKKFKGSLWQQKMKEKPEFYMFFKRKIEQYLS